MDQQQTMMFLQSLRGVQPMVVLCFLVVQRAMTVEEICSYTGLSDDAVRPAIKSMASKNWLFKQVGERGRATWFFGADTLFGQIAIQIPLPADSGDVVVVVESEGRNNLLSTSTTNKIQNPRSADSGLSAEELLNLAALKAAGIKGRNARRLARLPWVNVEYINAHAEQVKHEFWDNPQGMMISRIEDEEPPEETAAGRTEYRRVTIDRGKRGKETTSYDFDVDQHIADFMGHVKGCRCSDCQWILGNHGDTRVVCPDCKHQHCECEESEEE